MGRGKKVWLGVLGVWLLLPPRATAVERSDRVQRAIDGGVRFLKASQQEKGWVYVGDAFGQSSIGATALVGLTLLECDVPADDPAVKKAVEIVRKNAPSLVHTYSLSTSIWFLDRLGEEADVPLIESMTVRLLAGQKEAGWRYTCPPVNQEEVQRLTKLLNQQNVLKGSKDLPKQPKGQKKPDKRRQISPEIRDQLNKLARPPAAPAPAPGPGPGGFAGPVFAEGDRSGDNSNTQFAALALWVARRHGMPVEDALAKVEGRFRKTQLANGGWNYISIAGGAIPAGWTFPPSMTCAGLIGLAVGHGVGLEAAKQGKGRKHLDPDKDNHIKTAFTNLGSWLQDLSGVTTMGGSDEMRFYFLWSLERVAEIYGLETIGKRDWYAWGSSVLLRSQSADGGWYGRYSQGGVDTCFALLFLARANVAKDLSVSLRGRIRDPGMHALKAGGIDPSALQNKGVKTAKASEKKTAKDDPDIPKLEEPKGKVPPPPAAVETDDEETQTARKMRDELINAPAAQQGELLEKYKQSKGAAYTLALAGAIPKLSSEAKAKARDALAERLTRMTAATLRSELKDDDPEIRRAASLACAMKDDKTHIPDLIPLLDDPEPLVGRAAHAALKSLSNQDFGPDKEASPAERLKAVADWKTWWQKQSEK